MKQKLDRDRRVPLYRQCADSLRQAIESGQYELDEFLPPERELSTKLGVNRLTLRKGLLELIRAGLIESVPGAGNRVVMTQAKTSMSHAIGCVMQRRGGPLSESPYYADILESVEGEVTEAGFDLVYSSVKPDELWNTSAQARPNPPTIGRTLDGVILVGGLTDELALAYFKKCVHVVLIDKPAPHPGISSVMPDNMSGAYDATRHLAGLGHRRIVFLRAPLDPAVEARLAGYRWAMADAGLKVGRDDVAEAGYSVAAGYEAGLKLAKGRKQKLPTALLCINDECAVGALRAMEESGLCVPRDLSVVGFDDIALAAHSSPPLTTVRINRSEMGRLAARSLLDRLQRKQAASTNLLLRTELVVRGSTAAPAR